MKRLDMKRSCPKYKKQCRICGFVWYESAPINRKKLKEAENENKVNDKG